MGSKQANLRRLMKIEREKKAAIQSASRKNQEGCEKKSPKGILKTKSSYQSSFAMKGDKEDKDSRGSLIELMVGYSESDSEDSAAENKDQKNVKSGSAAESCPPLRQKCEREQKSKKQDIALESLKRKRPVEFMDCTLTAGNSSQFQGRNRPLYDFQHVKGQNDVRVSELSNVDVQNPVEDPGVMKEFEELLNYSVGDNGKDGIIEKNHVRDKGTKSTALLQNEPFDQKIQPQANEEKSAKSDPISCTTVEYTDDVEQVAYEARLARLMLLRTKQIPKNRVDEMNTSDSEQTGEFPSRSEKRVTPLDYVPALAFHDNNKEIDSINNNGDLPTKLLENVLGESKTNTCFESYRKPSSVPLSIILREKRAKLNLTSKPNCNDQEDSDYDAYWK